MAVLSRRRSHKVHMQIKNIPRIQCFSSTYINEATMHHAREGNAEARRLALWELNEHLTRYGAVTVVEDEVEWEFCTVDPS